jgi:outer membrane protein assembly factor BamB
LRGASELVEHLRKTSRKVSRNDPYAPRMRALLLLLALAACGKSKVKAAPGPEAFEEPRPVVFDNGVVVRKGTGGATLWTRPMAGQLGSVRPPDGVVGDKLLIIAVDRQLVALDDATGKERWRVDGPSDRLFVHDGLVFATDCSVKKEPEQRFVVARRLADGKEAFRVELPLDFDPQPMHVVGDRVVVTGWRDATVFFDAHDGSGRLEVDDLIFAAQVIGGDLLFASDQRIARIRMRDRSIVWSRSPPANRTFSGGGFVAVPGGDLLLFDYSAISDSGVEVIRLHPHDGGEVYRVQCAGAGVDHSEYLHRADVRLNGDRVSVHSVGLDATFDQELALATGKTLRRSVENSQVR